MTKAKGAQEMLETPEVKRFANAVFYRKIDDRYLDGAHNYRRSCSEMPVDHLTTRDRL